MKLEPLCVTLALAVILRACRRARPHGPTGYRVAEAGRLTLAASLRGCNAESRIRRTKQHAGRVEFWRAPSVGRGCSIVRRVAVDRSLTKSTEPVLTAGVRSPNGHACWRSRMIAALVEIGCEHS